VRTRTISSLRISATRYKVTCKILSVGAKEGKTPLVIITALNGEKKQKYTITEGTYREIGCPLSGEEIDGDALSTLINEDEKRRALLKSLNVLSYGDNNKKALFLKLLRSGFSKNAAEYAITECVMHGYIDEARQVERLVLKHTSELLGPHKIRAKLISRQYSPALINKTIRALEERGKIDFKKNKEALLSEKLGADATYQDKMKLLYRYGYINGAV